MTNLQSKLQETIYREFLFELADDVTFGKIKQRIWQILTENLEEYLDSEGPITLWYSNHTNLPLVSTYALSETELDILHDQGYEVKVLIP